MSQVVSDALFPLPSIHVYQQTNSIICRQRRETEKANFRLHEGKKNIEILSCRSLSADTENSRLNDAKLESKNYFAFSLCLLVLVLKGISLVTLLGLWRFMTITSLVKAISLFNFELGLIPAAGKA